MTDEAFKWIDISVDLAPDRTPVDPGTPPVRFGKISSIEKKHNSNTSVLHFGLHSGTHIDMPSHFLEQGQTIDDLDLSRLVGEAYVTDLRGLPEIDADALSAASIPKNSRRLLLKTDNSRHWKTSIFQEDFVGVSLSGAEWIVKNDFDLVGIDYLSIQAIGASDKIHTTLLEAGVLVLEGLDLSTVSAGLYELFCLPLKVRGVEGAPARALLRPL